MELQVLTVFVIFCMYHTSLNDMSSRGISIKSSVDGRYRGGHGLQSFS